MPDEAAQARSKALIACLKQQITDAGGAIPFDAYMEAALYHPAHGYYTNPAPLFGEKGDFITAPEISPLFSACIANQAKQVLNTLNGASLLEFGAGTGKMASDIMNTLMDLQTPFARYFIVERSPALQEKQRETIQEHCPMLLEKVYWVDSVPDKFRGVILANEVLDAMPVKRFRATHANIEEQVVRITENGFMLDWLATDDANLHACVQQHALTDNYTSEYLPSGENWIRDIANAIEEGIVLFIDYGFPASTFYHPSRHMGTLMCHYRHIAHPDPLVYPGLQDITAHVDFTHVAIAAEKAGLTLSGFTHQAGFLLNCGLEQFMTATDNPQEQLAQTAAIKKLTLPHEMGELFQVMALSKNWQESLLGFKQFDHIARL
ncbi:MAG: SAM-dependent methyltransferase [marine bacterium B5-7]|nr:MAG: SAM-dependent methyltransferase [marine bacterium B5-7]